MDKNQIQSSSGQNQAYDLKDIGKKKKLTLQSNGQDLSFYDQSMSCQNSKIFQHNKDNFKLIGGSSNDLLNHNLMR